MKVNEAIEVLKQMKPDTEVELKFGNSVLHNNPKNSGDFRDGNYETQAERFGRR